VDWKLWDNNKSWVTCVNYGPAYARLDLQDGLWVEVQDCCSDPKIRSKMDPVCPALSLSFPSAISSVFQSWARQQIFSTLASSLAECK
jgi:hypothetical protein